MEHKLIRDNSLQILAFNIHKKPDVKNCMSSEDSKYFVKKSMYSEEMLMYNYIATDADWYIKFHS